jgi:predicted DNA-binding transcriptional regulator AlpA
MQSPTQSHSRLMTVNEVYSEYRISPATQYRMMADGRLKSVRLAGRRLVPREVLEQMIGEQLAEVCELA